MNTKELQKTGIFQYTSYRFVQAKKQLEFTYTLFQKDHTPIVFHEQIFLPKRPISQGIQDGLLQRLLTHLHIALGLSYFKLFCPSQIDRNGIALSEQEANFWSVVYKDGLGELFYKNQLDPADSPKFPYSKRDCPTSWNLARRPRCLLGIGGGKDSLVAYEWLKEQGHHVEGFVLDTDQNASMIRRLSKVMGTSLVSVRRQLDEKLFLPIPGSFSGHIPITAIYSFIGVLCAVLYDYDTLAIGSEYSSSFGNVKYKGEMINHQWSKSAGFESLLQSLLLGCLTPDILYFSPLRPFHEIRVVKEFTHFQKYFSSFSSCNKNFVISRKDTRCPLWCGKCPKCAFAFILFSAFLSKSLLLKIFGKNLYEDETLLPLFADVLGLGNMKPFECVGTFEESQTGLYLAQKKFSFTPVMRAFLKKLKISEMVMQEVFRAHRVSTVPSQFQFLGMKNALILGYGKEGRVTQQFLRRRYPKLKIGIADQKNDSTYLERQKDYDITIKTPGIPKRHVFGHYTTATNIFFSHLEARERRFSRNSHPLGVQKYPITIGVTGSKGKSTTASLIAAMLTRAKRRVQLVGNIGAPMLTALLKPVKSDTIFVIELSSYQLDDIRFSPHIAVVLGLFPEHMDYHGGVKEYYEAKHNIVRFQRERDLFVYNPHDRILRSWKKTVRSRSIPFVDDFPFSKENVPLLGAHNYLNIQAATTVARLFGVSDDCIQDAIYAFKPLPHRLEFVGMFQGIHFYDDAISTAPESTIAAILALKKVETIFLGGEDRGYDFSILERVLLKSGIKNIVLFPKSGKRILHDREKFHILETKSMAEAIAFAYKTTSPGHICLLSTASPSYSLWKNFEEKGREFQKWVRYYGKRFLLS